MPTLGSGENLQDALFFWVSKLTWAIISPDSLILIMLLLSLVLLRRGSYRKAHRLFGITVAMLIVIAIFPVGEWLAFPLETRFPAHPTLPSHVHGVILLGGAEDIPLSVGWSQAETGEGAERFLAFLALARRYPQAKLVFTGGSGYVLKQKHKGADIARSIFKEQGLNPTGVIFEKDSRNTYENALYTKSLVEPLPEEHWILITSASHMPRSVGVFCRAGWRVTPYPVDHRSSLGNLFRIDFDLSGNISVLKMSAREWVGLLAYFLAGKTSVIFPESCS